MNEQLKKYTTKNGDKFWYLLSKNKDLWDAFEEGCALWRKIHIFRGHSDHGLFKISCRCSHGIA